MPSAALHARTVLNMQPQTMEQRIDEAKKQLQHYTEMSKEILASSRLELMRIELELESVRQKRIALENMAAKRKSGVKCRLNFEMVNKFI